MAAAAAGEPGFPKGNDVDSLIYAVILFSIATTALLVFLFEKTNCTVSSPDGGFVITRASVRAYVQRRSMHTCMRLSDSAGLNEARRSPGPHDARRPIWFFSRSLPILERNHPDRGCNIQHVDCKIG